MGDEEQRARGAAELAAEWAGRLERIAEYIARYRVEISQWCDLCGGLHSVCVEVSPLEPAELRAEVDAWASEMLGKTCPDA